MFPNCLSHWSAVQKNGYKLVEISRKKCKSLCDIYIVVHFFNDNFSVFGASTPPNCCFYIFILFHRLFVMQTKTLNNFHLFSFRNYSKNQKTFEYNTKIKILKHLIGIDNLQMIAVQFSVAVPVQRCFSKLTHTHTTTAYHCTVCDGNWFVEFWQFGLTNATSIEYVLAMCLSSNCEYQSRLFVWKLGILINW